VFFPYIVAWNESNNPNGAVDNITVATVVLTVDNSTNVTSTYTSTASTTINSKIVTINGTAAVKTFTITAGNPSSSGDLTFTTAV